MGNFVGCADGIADCEETLLKVETAGKLTVTTNADDDSTDAIDLYLYESDAEGTYDDSQSDLAEGGSAGTTGDEKLEVQVGPGYYNAVVKFFDASNDTYKGAAVLSGFAAPPATATPTPTPAGSSPSAQPQQPSASPTPTATPKPKAKKKSKRAACQKKAKKIKNKKKRANALKKCKKIEK